MLWEGTTPSLDTCCRWYGVRTGSMPKKILNDRIQDYCVLSLGIFLTKYRYFFL